MQQALFEVNADDPHVYTAVSVILLLVTTLCGSHVAALRARLTSALRQVETRSGASPARSATRPTADVQSIP
jgi:hypothetical protein